MMSYEDKIFERKCFLVTTGKMLDIMKKKKQKEDLEIHITKNPLDIVIYRDGEYMYDEEDMMECISDETGVEIGHMFFYGDEFGGVLYFPERRLE